jgi:RNA polymerase primary sigma factor
MTDCIGDYLKTIGRIPLLRDEEEIQYGKKIRDWLDHDNSTTQIERLGRRAKERMINGNLRLVVSIAKQYSRRISGNSIDMMDLIQAGNLGLIRAVEKYDPARGYRFSTYGYWWIKQSITRLINESDRIIRVPHSLLAIAVKSNQLQANHENGSDTNESIKLKIDFCKRHELAKLLCFYNRIVSLDQCISSGDSGEVSLKDLIPAPDDNKILDDYLWMEQYLSQLSVEETEIIKLRFYADRRLSLVDVSKSMGKTRHHIQTIERRALKKLKRSIGSALNQV